jgi:hypothetical protein
MILAIATAGMALLLSAGTAYAGVYSHHPGSICQNNYPGDATSIFHETTGTSTISPSTYVTCPLVRATSNTGGALAYVNIYHSASATTTCTLFSHDYNNSYLGSGSDSWTGTGTYRLTLNGTSSTAWSTYTVSCYIPGDRVGLIIGINLYEY